MWPACALFGPPRTLLIYWWVSDTLICKYRSILEATGHSLIFLQYFLLASTLLSAKISETWFHCVSYIQTHFVATSSTETEIILFWKGPLEVICPNSAQSMYLRWSEHITSSSLDTQHKIFMKRALLFWYPLTTVPLNLPFLLAKIQWH